MKYNPILISGRPGSGKTELIIALCNMHPSTTLLIAEEYDENYIRNRGLNSLVKVICAKEAANLSDYGCDTICIDYIELIKKPILDAIIDKAKHQNIRVIAVTQMRQNYQFNNPFVL